MCEQDRKSIEIRVNAIPIRWTFARIESDNHYPDTRKWVNTARTTEVVSRVVFLISLLKSQTCTHMYV